MTKVVITDTNLTNIANAIRAKGGTSELIKPSEMATAITNLPSGGGDYNATLVAPSNYTNGTITQLITEANDIDLSSTTSIDKLFNQCPNLEKVNLDLSTITSMWLTFYSCYKLSDVTLTNSDKVTTMEQAFVQCYALENITLDVSSVTNFASTFYQCTGLKNVNLIHTGNITTFSNSFARCSNLITAPTCDDLSSVTTMYMMFNRCSNLQNVPYYNVPACTEFDTMFYNAGYFLTDVSLDNILKMCISPVNYTGTKTLSAIGFTNNQVQASRWQSCPSYNNFVSAGWSIGY